MVYIYISELVSKLIRFSKLVQLLQISLRKPVNLRLELPKPENVTLHLLYHKHNNHLFRIILLIEL